MQQHLYGIRMSITYEERKKVFENIKFLSKPEHEEIYRILYRNKDQFTENSNGIFFDVSILTDESFLKIKEYLEFCLKNRMEHEERLKELDALRNETFVEEQGQEQDEQGESST